MPNPSIDITVDFSSLQALGARFHGVNLKDAINKGVQAFAFSIERYSKIGAPVDTGRMRASIATDIGDMQARIAPHTSYAIFVEEGTRFMKARPFMRNGLGQAKVVLFNGGKNPINDALSAELRAKLQ